MSAEIGGRECVCVCMCGHVSLGTLAHVRNRNISPCNSHYWTMRIKIKWSVSVAMTSEMRDVRHSASRE